ncbi:hypothetical protein V1512DRAFT_260116 [Lipomyces arxii]|uniref:uncharacterized protein n=1 Tax=Lipomyces arxii TaxID=56418 RepID=UPI0034CF94A8
MSYSANPSLQRFLADHPIFSDILPIKPEPAQKVNLASVKTAIDPSQEYSGYGLNDAQMRNVVVTRGTELFVAVNGQIRCADCARIRELGDHLQYYKTLNILGLDFPVKTLEINSSGTYLAIIGQSNIIVCALPEPGFAKRQESRLYVRHKNIKLESKSVLKALWHPLAKEDSSLVVLSSDGMIIMFDLVYSYEQPELSFNLRQSSSQDFSYGFSDSMELVPTSMCFGVADQGLGEMALYVLMESGDIYALCPFIPRQCVMERGTMQALLDWSLAEDREVDPAVSRAERFRIRQQLNWVGEISLESKDMSKVAGLAPRIGKYGELADLCGFSRPDKAQFSLILQGPISISPYPKQLYKSGVACDITSFEVDEFSVFCVAFSSGRVNICIEDYPVGALWDSASYSTLAEEDSGEEIVPTGPSFLLFESVALKCQLPADRGDKTVSFWFLPKPADGNSVLVAFAQRVVQLDISNWRKQLVNVLSSSEDAKLKSFLQSAPKTKVVSLFSSNNLSRNRVYAVAIIRDAVVGEVLVILTTEGLNAFETNAEEMVFASSATPIRQPSRLVQPPASLGLLTDVLIKPLDIDLSRLRRGSVLDSHLLAQQSQLEFSLTDKLIISEQVLKFFGDTVESLGTEVKYVHTAGHKIQTRMIQQREEMFNQLQVLSKISAKLEASQHDGVSVKVEQILARQQSLNERADKLYRRLMETQQIPISTAERKWIRELHRIRNTLEESRGLIPRTQDATRQSQKLVGLVNSVLRKYPNESPSRALVHGLQLDRIEVLKEMLDNEARIVNKTKLSLESLIKRVDSQMVTLRIEN